MAQVLPTRPRRIYHEHVTIAWVCAINAELQTARATLDEEFDLRVKKDGDPNTYVVGRIGQHNVAVACLDSSDDPSSATSTAVQLLRSFPNFQFGLMVGIGGGVTHWGDDIRLGDVVVAHPKGGSGGVVAFDVGKAVNGSTEYRSHFNQAPDALRSAANTLDSERALRRYNYRIVTIMEDASNALADAPWPPPDDQLDILYCAKAAYDRNHDVETCPLHCDPVTKQARRRPRLDRVPRTHRGLIATSHKVIADGQQRDFIVQDLYSKLGCKVLCFEMEASSLANKFPCLVIRGISDYADSSKSDIWQRYAALSAAAYAKELLLTLLPAEAEREGSLFEQSKDLPKDDPSENLYMKVMETSVSLQDAGTFEDFSDTDIPYDPQTTQEKELGSESGSVQSFETSAESQAENHNGDAQKSPIYTISSLGGHSMSSQSPATTEQQQTSIRERIKRYHQSAAQIKTPGGILHIAARCGDVEALDFLCDDLGFDIDDKWHHDSTPLHYAALGGSVAMMDHLLQLGQDIKAKDDRKRTVLHYAVAGGHVAMLDHLLQPHHLLELGQELKSKEKTGNILLFIAAQEGHIAMLDHLLKLGQDLEARDKNGVTVLHFAAIFGHIAMLDHLLQLGQGLEARDIDGMTVLHYAAGGGRIAMLYHLLQLGMDLKSKYSGGSTALHMAALCGQTDMVEHLAKLGLDVFERNNSRATPLTSAADLSHQDTVDRLRQLERDARRRQSELEAGSTISAWKHLRRILGSG